MNSGDMLKMQRTNNWIPAELQTLLIVANVNEHMLF